jgi:hypothetical protein
MAIEKLQSISRIAGLRIICGLALGLSLTMPAAAAELTILNCAGIADNNERLACFDREVVKMKQAVAQEERDTVTFFGLFGKRRSGDDGQSAQANSGGTDSPKVEIGPGRMSGLTAHVISTSVDSGGHTIVITDANQVWRTVEVETIRGASEGAEIAIKESAFNGYRLSVTGRTGEYRVQRIL